MTQNKNTIVAKGNFSGLGSKAIEEIIKEQGIDMNIYYVDSFKVKKGTWNTAAKKREQELSWSKENQITETKDGKGKVTSTKTRQNVQIMKGSSKHYPEFMMADNKTNSIEVTFKRRPMEVDILESYKELIKDCFLYPTR